MLAGSVIRYYECFRPDAVWLSADTWVTAEAMGAAVSFPAEDQPLGGAGEPCIRSARDLEKIPPPDPGSQGRFPVMIEALDRVRQALGREVFIVACFDQYPFSLACALMGIEGAMLAALEDPPMIEALMERCSDYTVAYALALAEAGAGMLSGGDSPAGLLGPKRYREVALPFEQKVITRLKERVSIPISLHICGHATPLLPGMAQSGAAVVELDHSVEMAEACRVLGPEMAIWGNLDPVALLAQGSPEQVRQATAKLLRTFRQSGHTRFVLSSGCTLALETPAENLFALIGAARNA
jgi:uroporphyrinogen decarboxylase